MMTKLAVALRQHFGGSWFSTADAVPIALRFGRTPSALQQLLDELGPGSRDPVTQARQEGDGLLEVNSLGLYSFASAIAWGTSVRAAWGGSVASTLVSVASDAHTARAPAGNSRGIARVGHPRAVLDSGCMCAHAGAQCALHLEHLPVVERVLSVVGDHRDATLFRFSGTMPAWNESAAGARNAATQFLRVVNTGCALAALLALDLRDEGACHWYGLVLGRGHRPAASAALRTAWLQCSCGTADGLRLDAVTGWDAFAASDDPNAWTRRGTFNENLSRTVGYTFKPWPLAFGPRNLDTDVLELGAFVGVTAAGRPTTQAQHQQAQAGTGRSAIDAADTPGVPGCALQHP